MAEVNVSLPHCHLCVVCVSFDMVSFLFNSGRTRVDFLLDQSFLLFITSIHELMSEGEVESYIRF